MLKKFTMRDYAFYFLISFLVIGTIWTFRNMNSQQAISYADIQQIITQQNAHRVSIDSDQILTIELVVPDAQGRSTITYDLYSIELFHSDFGDILMEQKAKGILADYDYPENPTPPLWMSLVPAMGLLLLFVFYVFLIRRNAKSGGGPGGQSNFGKAKARALNAESDIKVTFDDVAGAQEEKAELEEIVEFLRDSKRFSTLGARIPKGVLLVGPPGTGKTLLAKAVAGESGVNFLSISGSDFVELYVGVGASRVRDLFEQAKKQGPAIIFIDEIDAVGRQRGAGLGGGHDEREQTLNQLLVEMDGFAANEGVIVLAATNRVEILDPALLRPGRFDRQVYVGHPDMVGREEILKVHCRKKPLAEDVSLRDVARSTTGFTGADLENLMNEAALLAARQKRRFICMEHIQAAVIKVIAGPEKRSRIPSEKDRRITAYHEAGHAVAMHKLTTQDPVHRITIVPHGMAAGMTIHLPEEEHGHVSQKKLCEEITALLAGRAAEEIAIGYICTGAVNDLQRASAIARNMVTKYGMSSKLGNVVFDSGSEEVFIGRSMAQAKPYSEDVAATIDQEIKHLIDQGYLLSRTILTQNRSALDQVANYLLEHESMDRETFETLMSQHSF